MHNTPKFESLQKLISIRHKNLNNANHHHHQNNCCRENDTHKIAKQVSHAS
jgi:hypothetical protein